MEALPKRGRDEPSREEPEFLSLCAQWNFRNPPRAENIHRMARTSKFSPWTAGSEREPEPMRWA